MSRFLCSWGTAHGEERGVPLETENHSGKRRDRNALEMIATDVGTEVMCRAAKERRRTRGRRDSPRREEITRSKSALITASGPIASCGEISGTRCDNTVNRLGDDTVLEHGFGEVNHIVDDDFRAGCCKGKDVRGERSLPIEGRCERKMAPGATS